MDINGKKALVTGGAKRLGNAMTLMLAGAGAEVAVHYNRSETEAYDLCDMICNDGGTAFPIAGDLSCSGAVQGLFEELDAMDFHPEILINSASIFDAGKLLDADEESFHRNLDINALVPLLLSREMAKRVGSGVVINMLDSRITDFDRLHAPYHLSKLSLFSLTRMLSEELAPGFRFNAVAPGVVLPPIGATPAEAERWTERMKKSNPLESIGTAQQVCDAAEFLIRNDFVTGQIIFVDGGRHLKGSFYGL
ncbi:MAG: SDR family oxidoreductase [Spirochaetales bacterium]|nr:SDR family oxidoreductase [Spirochaetales bacterium]